MALPDISLTTNGQLLAGKLPLLRSAGIQRLNVSLDTLDPQAFRKIAMGGDLQTVLNGIEQARLAGMSIKINMVPMRGSNLDQVMPMLAFCLEQGYELRFIELMRMGHLAQHAEVFRSQFVGQRELLALIAERYAFTQSEAAQDVTKCCVIAQSASAWDYCQRKRALLPELQPPAVVVYWLVIRMPVIQSRTFYGQAVASAE